MAIKITRPVGIVESQRILKDDRQVGTIRRMGSLGLMVKLDVDVEEYDTTKFFNTAKEAEKYVLSRIKGA